MTSRADQMTEQQLDALRPRRVFDKSRLLTGGPGYVGYYESADIPTLDEEQTIIFKQEVKTRKPRKQPVLRGEADAKLEARRAYHREYQAKRKQEALVLEGQGR